MAARRSTIRNLADLAVECLIDEVNVSPKPGLVDRRGSGAHCDMIRRKLAFGVRRDGVRFVEQTNRAVFARRHRSHRTTS